MMATANRLMRATRARLTRILLARAALVIGLATHCFAVHAQETPQATPVPPHFAVNGFEVVGAHALPAATIDATLAPYQGASVTFARLEEAIAALKSKYREAGIDAVNIVLPQQDISNGIIKISVTEARLGKVEVMGNKYFSSDNIVRALPALVPGETPNMDDVAAEVRMSNDNPSKQIQVTLRQGATADSADALVRVSDENPMQFAVIFDNTGTSDSGRDRLGLAIHDANVFGVDHVLSAQFQTSPNKLHDVDIIGANYVIPLYSRNETLDLSAGYSNVNSGLVTTTAGAYGITGKGTTFGARLTQYLARSEIWNQRVFASLDWRAYKNDVTLGDSGDSLVPDVTTHPLGLGYAVNYTTSKLEGEAGFTYEHNIPGGSNGSSDDFRLPGGRLNATASYQLLIYNADISSDIYQGWRLHAALDGQATSDALVAPEQFGAGGIDSVRGFDERAATDDRGERITLEGITPDFGARLINDSWQLRGVLFYDAAKLARVDPLPGEKSRLFISSRGFGARIAYSRQASLRLDFANVINGADLSAKSSNRLQFSAIVTF
jgi:hemolysin activation/secretion protein